MAYFNGAKFPFIYHNGKRILINDIEVADAPEALTAPTISLDGDILTISGSLQDNPVAELVIFVDGVETATVEEA